MAVARRETCVATGAPPGPIYLPSAPDTQAPGLLVVEPHTWVSSVRFKPLVQQVSRAALHQVGAATVSAVATASIVMAAVNYSAGRPIAPGFERQILEQQTLEHDARDVPVTSAYRLPVHGFVERWGQAEFMPGPAEGAAEFERSVKTVRFTKPDNEPTASAPPRPRFPVAYSLASLGGQQVDIDKPDLLGKPVADLDDVSQYLWEVYQRSPIKKDNTGDFTWKDPAAAKRVGMSLPKYVIGGMDPDFREQLYHAGKAMDAAGVKWVILSAFRDDYRQRIAAGIKAGPRNSLHGGSVATGGYGHGRAVDVTGGEDETNAIWRWLDANGAKYGLYRPMPGYDPGHVQSRGDWRKLAASLRKLRIKAVQVSATENAPTQPAATRVAARAPR